MIGAFVAGLGFFGLSRLTWAFPVVAFAIGAVFLPVGVWVGRGSRHPWLEGFLYGLSAGIIVIGIMMGGSSLLQEWSLRFALLLAVPQGIVGTWIGARFFSRQEQEQTVCAERAQESAQRSDSKSP
jgi:membrane protein implicated in regulation of membrane protease activity